MSFEIDISCLNNVHGVDERQLVDAVRHALQLEGVENAVLSITVVDNPTIHRLNREHLQHDYPTDVISFQLDWSSPNHDLDEPPQTMTGRSCGASVEGEIIVSRDYAQEMAERGRWTVSEELILYVIHGLLHICGYDDLTATEKQIMRSRERAVLKELGLTPYYPDDDPAEAEPLEDLISSDSIADSSRPYPEVGQ